MMPSHLSTVDQAKRMVDVLRNAKESIQFSVQLVDAMNSGRISPDLLEKCLIVSEPLADNSFTIDIDWSAYPEIFKIHANNIQMDITNMALIRCKEEYPRSFYVEQERNNPDLYAAQWIFKYVRDAIVHSPVESKWNIPTEKEQRIYEIKSLGIKFDAREIHGHPFKLRHFGGLSNLLILMDFIRQSLEKFLDDSCISSSSRCL